MQDSPKEHGKGGGKRRDPWVFHPFEYTFSGFSGSGKTTLLEKLCALWSARALRVGYAKHDAHGFGMDREGKDTWRLRQAGACTALINDGGASALLGGPLDDLTRMSALLDADLVLVEGHKYNKALRKIVLLDEAGKMRALLADMAPDELLAVVTPDLAWAAGLPAAPVFHRDDVAGLAAFVEADIARRVAARPLRGLVLLGGRSTRMGEDKGALAYHGRSMAAHAAALLARHCSDVSLSCRADQPLPEDAAGLPRLEDRFLDFGPLGGILSAFAADEACSWLVMACDLPHAGEAAINTLVAGRDPLKFATAFRSRHDGWPEPLLAVYEPKSRSRLLQFLAFGRSCPRKMMINSPVCLLEQQQDWLENCNNPQERTAALRRLQPGVQP